VLFENLGTLAKGRGNRDAAKSYFEGAMKLYAELEDESGTIDALHKLQRL
jgi:hypothetical protein